jgi:hypothetical protein
MELDMNEGKNKVVGSLIGIDGNAFALMSHFSRLAKAQGFDKEFIDKVLDEAQSSNYDHLVQTLDSNME